MPAQERSLVMDKQSKVVEFLEKANGDPKLAGRLYKVFGKHGRAQAAEILKIARVAGYTFTRGQFESAVMGGIATRFRAKKSKAGRRSAALKPKPRPPQSACSRGCLSWTVNFCPFD
jgi:hypothetical protein